MSKPEVVGALEHAQRHAHRLQWAKEQLQRQAPFSEGSVQTQDDVTTAIIDQFIFRFAKLQDAMGAQLFPAILDLTAEPGPLNTFDLLRLFQYLLEIDPASARAARNATGRATGVLQEFPFTCRKAETAIPLIRELIIPFGSAGYVALFEIDDNETVTILATRHQREDDYYR